MGVPISNAREVQSYVGNLCPALNSLRNKYNHTDSRIILLVGLVFGSMVFFTIARRLIKAIEVNKAITVNKDTYLLFTPDLRNGLSSLLGKSPQDLPESGVTCNSEEMKALHENHTRLKSLPPISLGTDFSLGTQGGRVVSPVILIVLNEEDSCYENNKLVVHQLTLYKGEVWWYEKHAAIVLKDGTLAKNEEVTQLQKLLRGEQISIICERGKKNLTYAGSQKP